MGVLRAIRAKLSMRFFMMLWLAFLLAASIFNFVLDRLEQALMALTFAVLVFNIFQLRYYPDAGDVVEIVGNYARNHKMVIKMTMASGRAITFGPDKPEAPTKADADTTDDNNA